MNKKHLFLIVFILIIITACNQVSNEKRNEEALALQVEDVPAWLKKHDISIPSDLESSLNINEFVLEVIQYAEQGIDSSVAISYDKTVKLIKDIQKAAGYTFKESGY